MTDRTVESLLDELEEGQQKVLYALGRRIVPTLTTEDLLQPNDYPELEENPHFRYEEGVLAGIKTVRAAIRANCSL
jgi:hypothetical protein